MTDTALTTAIKAIARRETLAPETLEAAFDLLLSGEAAPEEIGAFLMGLAVRGETAAELTAGARIMRQHARAITLDGPVLDTCGTGGLPWKSLNTSTASALVIAAAGGRVAKHGNRSVPPKTGSADVLEALGVNLETDEHEFRACPRRGRRRLHVRAQPSQRHAPRRAGPRKTRHPYDLQPARPLVQSGGARNSRSSASSHPNGRAPWLRPSSSSARPGPGSSMAWTALTNSPSLAPTHVCEVSGGAIREFEIHPADAGLDTSPLSRLEGGNVADNALAITELLDSQEGPFRDAVLLNAAAGLHVFGKATDLKQGVAMAAEAIDTGKARDTLRKLVSLSNGQEPV